MAVTLISYPAPTPTIISASHPAVFKVSSDKYGTAGVTQFRFLAIVTAGAIDLGTKFTVVSESPNIGYIDCANMFRELIRLSEIEYGTSNPLTKITTLQGDDAQTIDDVSVQVKEQYFLNGAFTENTGSTVNFKVARGYSDDANYDWVYDNWWRFNGLENFIPYSGKMPMVYRTFTDMPGWNPLAPYLNVHVTRLNDAVTVYDMWVTRTGFEFLGACFFPIYKAGVTDIDSCTGVHVEVGISVSVGHSEVVQYEFDIEKTITVCDDDEEILLMFQDRFLNWSFMSFVKKHMISTNTQPQQAEAPTGRFRYNVDSSDTWTLNTDWLPEQMNPLFKDLIVTEQCFIVDSVGGLEAVTIVPNSFRYKTSRNDGLIQYTISVRKSLDNFKP